MVKTFMLVVVGTLLATVAQANENLSLSCKVPGGYQLELSGTVMSTPNEKRALGLIAITKNGKSVGTGTMYDIKFQDSGQGLKVWVYEEAIDLVGKTEMENGVGVAIRDDGKQFVEGFFTLKDGTSLDVKSGFCEVDR